MKQIVGSIFEMGYSARILPGVSFPVRTIVVEFSESSAMIISPGPDVGELEGKYREVFAVAPNAFHHLHLQSFVEKFSDRDVYAPPGVRKKQPGLATRFKEIKSLPERLGSSVECYAIWGNPFLQETVFYIPYVKTLLVTDLIFNMRSPMPWTRSLLLSMVDARDKIGQSKLVTSTIKDPEAYRKSIASLEELNVERIVMSHGKIITDSKEVARAFDVMKSV